MNERIAQLIQQATMIEDHYPEGCNGHPVPRVWFDKVKFAELIVQECAMISRSTKREDVDGGAVMRQRFGLDKPA